jgi:hypothetical protein
MGFPPANAEIYYNEAGEPTAWDVPGEPEYFDCCGVYGRCVCDDEDEDYEDNQDEEDYKQAMWEIQHPDP